MLILPIISSAQSHIFNGRLDSTVTLQYFQDSTWTEDKVDTIKTQWVIVSNNKGVLKKKWLKEVVFKYKKISHTYGLYYRRPGENIINREYYIKGKIVDLIAYQLLDTKYKSVFFNYE